VTAPTPPPAGDSTPGPRKPRTGGPRKDKGGKPGSPSRAQRKAERAAEALAVAAAAEKAKRPPREKPVAAPPRPLVPPREDGLPWVIAVFGPTASGKTALAEAIADSVDGEVVSCDSMQCYAGLPILTNQPERETRLVGIWPLTHSGSVGEYQALAHAAIDEIVSSGQVAVVTGGTGLYLRAALAELHLPPAPRPGLRQEMEALHARLGAVEAHRELARRDPEAAAALHPNDTRRVIRALELHSVGKTLTPDRDRLWSKTTRLSSLIVGLDVERDLLARRIAERTAAMWWPRRGACCPDRGRPLRPGTPADRAARDRARPGARRVDRVGGGTHAAVRAAPAHLDAQDPRDAAARRLAARGVPRRRAARGIARRLSTAVPARG
jgi:tRNA dimethylallyltransferase